MVAADITKDILFITNQYTGESFVAKPSVKSTIETLRNRATCSVPDKFTNSPKVYYPVEQLLKNAGFKVTIGHKMVLNPNNKRYKLIECVAEKDGHSFKIYFESTALLMAIRESTVIKGEFQEEIRIGISNGMPSPITEEAYSKLIQESKSSPNGEKVAKTTKYEPGKVYTTESRIVDETFISTLYSWFEPIGGEYDTPLGIKLLDKPNTEYLFVDNRTVEYAFNNTKVHSIADLCSLLKSATAYSVSNKAPYFINTVIRNLRKSKVSRIDTGISIDSTDYSKYVEDVIEYTKSWLLNGNMSARVYYSAHQVFEILGLTTVADKKPDISGEKLELILDNLFDEMYIEIDGTKHYGRRHYSVD